MAKEFEAFREAADYARQLASEEQCTSRLSRSGEGWIVSPAHIGKPELENLAAVAPASIERPTELPKETLTPEQEWEHFWRLASRVEEGRGGTRADVAQAFSHLVKSGNPTALKMQLELLKADAKDGLSAAKYSSKTVFGRDVQFGLAYLVSGSYGSKYDYGQGQQ